MTTNKQELDIFNNIIHFGLDHLEVYGTCRFEEDLFEKLDFDNSNYGELEDYSFTKNEVKKYQYKIIFNKDNYSLFAYYKGDPESNSHIKSKDKIVVYSTAFKLLTKDEIYHFLSGYFSLDKCCRFDICADINLPIDEILQEFIQLKTGTDFKKSGNIETRYIGDYNKYRNKRQVIRVYNKILDINVKHKNKLYKEYLVEDFVTRVELEIRPELARNLQPIEVFDDVILSGVFKNYLGHHTYLFNRDEIENIKLFKKVEKQVNQEEYQGTLYKQQRRAVFVGHAKTIYELGYCPVRVLIGEGLLLDDTKKFLDRDIVERIGEIERDIKRENLFKKEQIFSRISSNGKKNG